MISKKALTSFLALLLSFVMMFSLFTGCGGNADKKGGEPSPSAEPTLSPEEIAAAEAKAKEEAALANFKSSFYETYQNDNFDAKNIVLTFAAISDTHIGLYDQTAKVDKGMSFLSRRLQNGLDAVLVNGDLTNHFRATNNEALITEARDVLLKHVPENTVFFYSLGTAHDADGFNTTTNRSGKEQRAAFNTALGSRFVAANVETEDERINNGFKHAIVNNYHFLSIDNDAADYSKAALNLLKKTLTELTEAESNKPVFVMTHIPAYSSLETILKNYPQVIYFTAHEHIPFNTPQAIEQKKYTTLAIGGFGYYRENSVNSLSLQDNNNNYEYGQGYLVEVDKNSNTRVIRLDMYNEVVLNDSWVIPAPKDDGSHLACYSSTAKKSYAKAEFAEGAAISLEIDESNPKAPAKITFPAAKASDGQPITMYNITIDITEGSGTSRSEKLNISSLYMKYPNGIGMPESYTVEVDGVAPPYSYEITIKAYNCLNRASSALKGEFKTEGFCEIITQAEASAK